MGALCCALAIENRAPLFSAADEAKEDVNVEK
jgi:hypothetical protein